ncbi:MAG TPA: hypothetical protein VNH83_09950, partial [Bryobacteraceae bacterium]|nr:hypothetical protein [Bryobacteraceae bacterium]
VTVDDVQIKNLVATLGALKSDTATALADIAAKLATAGNTTADPATAAAITAAIADITTLDTNIKAADPGPITQTGPAVP